MQTTVVASPEPGSDAVLVEQPTEAVSPLNNLTTAELVKGHFGDGLLQGDAGVGAFLVIVGDELAQEALGMAFAADEHPVQALGPGREHNLRQKYWLLALGRVS